VKYINRIIAVLLALGAVFAALYFIPVRRNVDMFLPCVMWELEDLTTGETEGMEIKGKYYDYLIKHDCFKGSVRISEVNDYDENPQLEIVYAQVDDLKMGSMLYFSETNCGFLFVGTMYMKGTFDDTFIALYVDENSPLNGKYLCAPATTIEEAVVIAKEMNFT